MKSLTKKQLSRPGIYLIKNLKNDLIYIGKSINLYKRKCQYNSICNGSVPNKIYNQRFINHLQKHGKENFIFEVLEFLEPDDELIAEREYYWMKYYNSYNKEIGYNLILDSSTRLLVSDETKKKISNRLKSEWKNGLRNNHSQKLSESWQRKSDEDRQKQSNIMKNNLTKWKYIVIFTNGNTFEMDYQNLKSLKLHNVLANFKRKNCNIHTRKDGTVIKRILIEDIVQPLVKTKEYLQ